MSMQNFTFNEQCNTITNSLITRIESRRVIWLHFMDMIEYELEIFGNFTRGCNSIVTNSSQIPEYELFRLDARMSFYVFTRDQGHKEDGEHAYKRINMYATAAMSINNMLNNAFLNEKIAFRYVFNNDKCDTVFWINHYIQQQFNYISK